MGLFFSIVTFLYRDNPLFYFISLQKRKGPFSFLNVYIINIYIQEKKSHNRKKEGLFFTEITLFEGYLIAEKKSDAAPLGGGGNEAFPEGLDAERILRCSPLGGKNYRNINTIEFLFRLELCLIFVKILNFFLAFLWEDFGKNRHLVHFYFIFFSGPNLM
jgi:hypothetical protein